MEDAQAFFGQPGVGFLEMLLIGAIAGWIAGKVTDTNHSIFTNILLTGGEDCGRRTIFFRPARRWVLVNATDRGNRRMDC